MDYAHDICKTTSMLAFEIYGSRDGLYNTHLNSPAMSRFLKRVPAASTTCLDLNYYRLVAGFLDSSRGSAPAEIMQDIRITCTSASRDTLLTCSTKLVTTIQVEASKNAGTGDVLTYMAFASLDDDDGARIFGGWRTGDGLERFIRRDVIKDFLEGE